MLIGKIGKDGRGDNVSLSHKLIQLINVQQIIIHVILINDVPGTHCTISFKWSMQNVMLHNVIWKTKGQNNLWDKSL